MNIQFNHSPIYQKVYTTDKPIIDLVGGRGRGGSFFGTDYFLFCMLTKPYFRGCFLRHALNDIRDSLYKDFKDRVEEKELSELFSFNDQQMRVTCTLNKNEIASKGVIGSGVRTAKLKSMAGFTHVLIEEADELDKAHFDQLFVSLRTVKADKIQVLRIFNPPPKDHWLWDDYNLTDSDVAGYYTYSPKSESDIELAFGTYKDNEVNLKDTAIRKLESFKDEEYYVITRGLISNGKAGRVYKSWQPITDKVFNDVACRPVYVVDFGYSEDPCAVIQVKWQDNKLYVQELVYEPGLDDLTLAKRFIDMGITYNDLIIADYGNGGDLRIKNFVSAGNGAWDNIVGYEVLRYGFSMVYAEKGAGSINAGIDFVKQYEVHMTEGSVNGWEEARSYSWAKGRLGELTTHPIDKHNHIMDCIRYFAIYRATKGV
jgi:phage terminase large subunit